MLADGLDVEYRDHIVFHLCLSVYVLLWLVALSMGGYLARDCVLYCLLDHKGQGAGGEGAKDRVGRVNSRGHEPSTGTNTRLTSVASNET